MTQTLATDAIRSDNYSWPFKFTFPKASKFPAWPDSDPGAPPWSLPPSISLDYCNGSVSFGIHVEYSISASFEIPTSFHPSPRQSLSGLSDSHLFTPSHDTYAPESTDPMSLIFVSSQRLEPADGHRRVPTSCRSMTFSHQILGINTRDYDQTSAAKAVAASQLQVVKGKEIPQVEFEILLFTPAIIRPGVGPTIRARAQARSDGCTTGNRPEVMLQDMKVFLSAGTFVYKNFREHGVHHFDLEWTKVLTQFYSLALSWDEETPVARIFLHQIGSDGKEEPIIPTFSFGSIARKYKLWIEATVKCLDKTYSVQFDPASVRICSPGPSSKSARKYYTPGRVEHWVATSSAYADKILTSDSDSDGWLTADGEP
ncbi:hypothetical protein FQN54_007378 [Arachnomyces sp. PD_36]|nr:hypothetical protein FQN54_007378 [Arachnomyces sp. PD_36]